MEDGKNVDGRNTEVNVTATELVGRVCKGMTSMVYATPKVLELTQRSSPYRKKT